MEKVIERFLKYAKVHTTSSEESQTVPTTAVQTVFAKELAKELEEIGLKEVSMDDKSYVFATLPSNLGPEMEGKVKVLGLISHMDTSPDMSGENVKPQFVENYDGGDIVLNKENNIVLSPNEFPELLNYKGQTLITTDGTTLLGADDKAGVSEIVTAMEYLIAHPEIKHGKIRIGFTPDEEVGAGADHFDVKKFGADYAYTIDGGTIGELEFENFNAADVKIHVQGRNVHPGSAKDKMINSIFIANELVAMLPKEEVPEKTEGYEGFYHLMAFNGDVESSHLHIILRDFDMEKFENKKKTIHEIVDKLNKKYNDCIIINCKDQYFNMKEKIDEAPYVVEIAKKAMGASDVVPKIQPIRGGTDGARLSFMGLPTPNIFTGGENFHGKYEYVSVESMKKALEVIINIVKISSTMDK